MGTYWYFTGSCNTLVKMGALENQQRAQESFSQNCVYYENK